MATPHFQDENIIIHKMECGPYGNNIYLVVCPKTNESIFIDTPAEPDKMIELAKTTDVKAIIITHNHMDHLLGFEDVTAAIDAPVGIGADDAGRAVASGGHAAEGRGCDFGGQRELDIGVHAGAYAGFDLLLHRGTSVFRRYAVSRRARQVGFAGEVQAVGGEHCYEAVHAGRRCQMCSPDTATTGTCGIRRRSTRCSRRASILTTCTAMCCGKES